MSPARLDKCLVLKAQRYAADRRALVREGDEMSASKRNLTPSVLRRWMSAL